MQTVQGRQLATKTWKDGPVGALQQAVADEAVKIPLSENAIKVLERRYLKKDETGRVVERPEDMFYRVARNIADAERVFGEQLGQDVGEEVVAEVRRSFFEVMARREFMPNSPTLMNAGRELQQLSACFVLPVEDSISGIFETIKQAALIHKSGGGTGFAFSRLRPRGDYVKTTSGVASGPISFMRIFDAATEQIKQGGKRRGANMGILRVDHPDILEFIDCKAVDGQIRNFNISVAITDTFMEAYKQDGEYALINPRNGEAVKWLRARDVLQKIAEGAWRNGEPGLFFVDRTNARNPLKHQYTIESTNPCGEKPLGPYSSCNLGSINLEAHLQQNGPTDWVMDWDHLGETVDTTVRFLDNVIEMNAYPIEQIAEVAHNERRIGLGVMGFARMLFKLQVPYGSPEGVACAREVMRFIRERAEQASVELAATRGVYPWYSGSDHEKQGLRLRNGNLISIAPTGTISMIADTSGGCEPEFALAWYKNVMDGTHLPYLLDYLLDVARAEGFYHEGLVDEIVANRGSVKGLESVPEHWQRVFQVSFDVAPQAHVRMQAAFQEYSDSAVSKTINLPNEATVDEVYKAYLLAYDLGCKGITVYRDGSRSDQVLNVAKSEKKEETPKAKRNGNGNGKHSKTGNLAAGVEAKGGAGRQLSGLGTNRLKDLSGPPAPATTPVVQPSGELRPRPDVTVGTTIKKLTGCGNMYVTINEDTGGNPFELFSALGKAGGCASAQTETIARLVSLALRSGVDPRNIISQLSGISCHRPAWEPGGKVLSCGDAISKAMVTYLERRISLATQGGQAVALSSPVSELIDNGRHAGACPDCGGHSLEHASGCVVCHGCGWSECG